jgi:hypothetical protein
VAVILTRVACKKVLILYILFYLYYILKGEKEREKERRRKREKEKGEKEREEKRKGKEGKGDLCMWRSAGGIIVCRSGKGIVVLHDEGREMNVSERWCCGASFENFSRMESAAQYRTQVSVLF